ncbi:unnamed protein product [Chironomus riparius]|uniref:Hemolymph juvenile hormone binding protein n=1 Tax=Chironomus riparius TaxID=315576 RepID=A0A9N9WYJ6_9DIPT|nr:unnamed protein product [Chironomus riparius]
MNQISLIFVAAVAISCSYGVSGALPSSVKICHRNDPQINECIIKSIEQLRPRLAAGSLGDGFDLPKIEPFAIQSIKVGTTQDFKVSLKNVLIKGASNFRIEKLRANVNDIKVDVIVNFPKLDIKANYDLIIKIFGQNLDNKGDGFIKLENARARVSLKGSKYSKDGKEYIKFDRFRLKVQPGTIRQLKLSNLFQNDRNIEEAANAFITANSDFLLQNVYPTIEKDLAELLTNVANELAKNATYDELFPL